MITIIKALVILILLVVLLLVISMFLWFVERHFSKELRSHRQDTSKDADRRPSEDSAPASQSNTLGMDESDSFLDSISSNR